MYRSREEIKDALKAFLQSMIDLANQDQVIDQDEKRILETLEKQIETMQEQLIQILESGLNQNEFRDLEQQILGDMVTNVTKIAEEDGVITDEEMALLERLKEFAARGVVFDE